MQSPEIEIKLPVSAPAAFEAALPSLGFVLETPRTFERNTLYDDRSRSLRGRGQILRLRQYGERWVVTHKRHPENEDLSAPYKVRIETESLVEDGPALETIFLQLGLEPVFRYEKYRTEWASIAEHGAHLVIDETPIGTWAELEGSPAWIDRTLKQLDVDRALCLTDSYGKLFLHWKQETGSSAEHLTFEDVARSVEIPA
jgi:adenylate cyclase class 2